MGGFDAKESTVLSSVSTSEGGARALVELSGVVSISWVGCEGGEMDDDT